MSSHFPELLENAHTRFTIDHNNSHNIVNNISTTLHSLAGDDFCRRLSVAIDHNHALSTPLLHLPPNRLVLSLIDKKHYDFERYSVCHVI